MDHKDKGNRVPATRNEPRVTVLRCLQQGELRHPASVDECLEEAAVPAADIRPSAGYRHAESISPSLRHSQHTRVHQASVGSPDALHQVRGRQRQLCLPVSGEPKRDARVCHGPIDED